MLFQSPLLLTYRVVSFVSWLACYSGSWVWTWLYETTMGTSWTQMKPAQSLSSGPMKLHPKGLMKGSRRRRYISCRWLCPLQVTSTQCICAFLLRISCCIGSRTRFFCVCFWWKYSPSLQSLQQNLDLRGQPIFNTTHTYSLYVNFKNFVCNIGEDAELLMSLYDPDLSKFIR